MMRVKFQYAGKISGRVKVTNLNWNSGKISGRGKLQGAGKMHRNTVEITIFLKINIFFAFTNAPEIVPDVVWLST